MTLHGKGVSHFVPDPPTGVSRGQSGPARVSRRKTSPHGNPKLRERFVSTSGPDHPPPPIAVTLGQSPVDIDVRFIASAKTLKQARSLQSSAPAIAGTAVIIYSRARLRNRFRLWPILDPAAPSPRSKNAVAYDLFRVPADLASNTRTLAATVARVLDGFGQQPPPSGVGN